ncbi:uncharacterized protein N7477_003639 [Penicillium maclennaniae]|uniref:uncharacterized protein n=1 Tax=Penicillium maclennaniae TaxID=1343394 RepID=UPI002541BBAF|nr:uncharacterized protein N7477_003639 [Penicillium maclennaniae]KAJ5678006.1 hypothetical protein N7477_003639 [Penicillium maclennaniae]
MTDAPESPRRPPSAAASHLQYPTLPPLTASVEQWLSHSRPTNNMASDRPSEPPHKSLSDSWATLSVSDLHSEDGNRSEQTDTASLIDQTTPDDVASLDERYSSSEADGPDEEYRRDQECEETHRDEAPSTRGSQLFPKLYTHAAGIDDSGLTTRPRQLSELIEFPEPEMWPETERVEFKHTTLIFDDKMAAALKSQLPAMLLPSNTTDSILMATVQQTMTKHSLDLDKPFRVLYVGQPEYRNIILDKIGDVLVSSSSTGSPSSSAESSRYHVVPTSFGAGAVPNFAELLPIHVQLVVDECMEATVGSSQDQPQTLHLTFKNRPSCRSWWDGDKYCVSSASEWTLPDMAIIFVSSHDDASVVQTQRLAHAFLERHGIPAMVISEEPMWERVGETVPLNQDSLHMCLESRNAQTGETVLLRRYPIDLETFESITPSQLNRNLASLMELYPNKLHKTTADTPSLAQRCSNPDPEKYPLNWIPPAYASRACDVAPMLRLVTLTLISAIALSVGYAAVKTVVIFLAQCIAGSALSHISSPSLVPIPTTAMSFENVRQTALSVRPDDQVGLLQSQSSDNAIMEQITGLSIAGSAEPRNPDKFEIQVVGDCHVVIKPPRNLASSKKQARFNVSVQRYDQALPYELSRLFYDVYSLRLDREEAYGLINVTVTAKSKIPIRQTTVVDFGTPWLKIANWRRAARIISSQVTKELGVVQSNLNEVYGRLTTDLTDIYGHMTTDLTDFYGHLSTDLQSIAGSVAKRSHHLRANAECLHLDGLHARESLRSSSTQLSTFVHNALGQLRSATSVLHSRSVYIDQEARTLFGDARSFLENSAAKVNVRSMIDRMRSTNYATLDRAQTRARQVVGLQSAKSDCSGDSRKC